MRKILPTLGGGTIPPAAATDAKVHRRFDRLARLFGDAGVGRLAAAHVAVVGVGGVGSFAAEALARSAVGRLTLIDFDLVCVTNSNRQLHAMKGTVGKPKVEVMAERLRLVHPTARIDAVRSFYGPETRDALFADGARPDWIIDAIDNVTAKLDLIAHALRHGAPIVSAMGAAGRFDPTRVRVTDLAETARDGLAKDVRRYLQRKHGVVVDPHRGFGVHAVWTDEPMSEPADVGADAARGFECVCPQGENEKHTCDARARIDGTASFVVGAFGLAAAGHVVRAIARPELAARTHSTPRQRPRQTRAVRAEAAASVDER
jgi:tRNA A37 threonylcarbamoyladenosine dehydratase